MPLLQTASLPFPESWDEFETLVWELFRNIWNDPNTEKNGRQGQAQHGVDIYGRPDQKNKWVGVQCKNVRNLTADMLKTEVRKARCFSPELSQFIVATTASVNASTIEVARVITAANMDLNLFSVHIMDWDALKRRLAEYPEIIQRYYPQFFYPADGTSFPMIKLGRDLDLRVSRLGQFYELYAATDSDEYKESIISICSAKSPHAKPDNLTAATIGRLLISSTIKTNIWSLRQTLGHIIGNAYNDFNTKVLLTRELDTISEQVYGTYGGEIILSIALTQGRFSAAVGGRHIRRLFTSSNPQIGWQFFKKWLYINPIEGMSDCFDTNSALYDPWRRRRLIVSLAIIATNFPHIFSEKDKELFYAAARQEIASVGQRFLIVLHLWLSFAFNSSVFERLDDSRFSHLFSDVVELAKTISIARDSDLHQIGFEYPGVVTEENLETYSYYLDLCCLNLDSPDARYSRMGQGRYSTILKWVNNILNLAPMEIRERLVREMLKCHDEGVRWAIAKVINNVWPAESTLYIKIVSNLLMDWHPWVVRETIDSITGNARISEVAIKSSFLPAIIERIEGFESASNPSVDELKLALMRLIIRTPGLASEINIQNHTYYQQG